MHTSTGRRPAVQDLPVDDTAGPVAVDEEPAVAARWAGSARGAASITRALTVLLWLLVTAGSVGGIAAFLRPTATSTAAPSTRSSTGPAGWAQAFIATYLAAGDGQDATLAAFAPGLPDLTGVTAGARYAARTSVLRALEVSPGYWLVTVAVDELTRTSAGAYAAAGLSCYRVTVAAHGDAAAGGTGTPGAAIGYAATRLPERDACPPTFGRAPTLTYGAADTHPTGPAADLVQRFLAALLTGNGEISRYTIPGLTIRPITLAPYSGIQLLSLATDAAPTATASAPTDGQSQHVLATVQVASPSGLQVLTYPLRLTAAGGQWQVSLMNGIAELSTTNPLPAVSPPPSPSPASSPLPTPTVTPTTSQPPAVP